MGEAPLWPYQCPVSHETVSGIIRRRSTNHSDVREVALEGLDLSFARNILDLGCGFGFLAEVLAPRVAADARFVGVDAWSANEGPFLEKITANGRTARFLCARVGGELPWSDHTFDLVVCSYSLYFFVDVVPEVARVLVPEGLFLTITHSEQHVVGQLPDAGFAEAASGLLAITRRFSAENGGDLLRKWFGEVTRIDYPNSLRFEADHLEELLAFLRFKLPVLVPGAAAGDRLPEKLEGFAREALAQDGTLVVGKSDAVFRCRSPLCR